MDVEQLEYVNIDGLNIIVKLVTGIPEVLY